MSDTPGEEKGGEGEGNVKGAAEINTTTDPNAADPNAANLDIKKVDAAGQIDLNAAITTTTDAGPKADADNSNTANTPAVNAVYTIIQIDADKNIKVLDAIPDGQPLNKKQSPYDLLANKTESVFAVKIVKMNKDECKPTDQIKCIDFESSRYEMDLTSAVSDEPTPLLNQEFLTGSAAEDAEKVAKDKGAESKVAGPEVDESEVAGPEVDESKVDGPEVAGPEVAESKVDESKVDESKDAGPEAVGESITGGSRKKRTQKSKKTKRKYYVYRK